MITLLLSLAGMVIIGGGIVVVGIIIVIIAIIQAIINHKPSGKVEQKNEEPTYYRYILINMITKQIVGAGNDYLEVCRKKRELGEGIMIRDMEYVKKVRW